MASELAFLLLLLSFRCLLWPPAPAFGQEPPADAAEISRDLLYHPSRRIEVNDRGVFLRAAQFTYRFDPAANLWEVLREGNFTEADTTRPITTYRSANSGVELRFSGTGSEDEGILEIRRGGDDASEPLVRLRLWTREQLVTAWLARFRKTDPRMTREGLAQLAEPAEPEVAGVADDGAFLWLAIRHYAGEGSLGIGSVVRLDPKANEATVYQPSELATSSVTHIISAGGALWLGTYRQGEGDIEATAGVLRFEPSSGEVRSYVPGSSPLVGNIVTAMGAGPSRLWVASDEGMCHIALPGAAERDWMCWRTVPTVRVSAPRPVSSRPGGTPRGKLPAGSYEVRWANAAFLEVVTPDAMEGWLAADDFEEYVQRHFDADAYELANTSGGGASVMRLLDQAGGDPLAGAQVYRARLERVGSPTPEGWQCVCARAGWISRDGLQVAPVVQPVAPERGPSGAISAAGSRGSCACR